MSTTACYYFSVEAEGSGIPELKTILSGINFYKYFHIKTFFVKIFGLITAQAAGLFIGFEGPIIHLSAMVAENLLNIPYFQPFKRVFSKKLIKKRTISNESKC